MTHPMIRLAVVVSHPIQYYAPWFRELALQSSLRLKVFYLWDFGTSRLHDPGFGTSLQWDLPLLEGYESSFVANASREPGTHHRNGLHNPCLVPELFAWKPDVILLFGYVYRTHLQLMLDPRLWHVPILFRGDSHLLLPRADWRFLVGLWLRRLLFRRFAAALAVGQANRCWLQQSGFQPRRIVMAPHAVNNAWFQAQAPEAVQGAAAWRRQLGIKDDVPVLLFAGKLEGKKRPLDLLEAFAALRYPMAVLVFVGSGELEPELRRRAAALPPGQVHFLGFQNQSAMARVYALANLVVLPSFGSGETWGLCINEAMNLAKPVIVSSHVGCGPDLVIPGETGWIFPAGDVPALTALLHEALADLDRLRRMGLAARRHIDRYSYAATTAGLHTALGQLELQR